MTPVDWFALVLMLTTWIIAGTTLYHERKKWKKR